MSHPGREPWKARRQNGLAMARDAIESSGAKTVTGRFATAPIAPVESGARHAATTDRTAQDLEAVQEVVQNSSGCTHDLAKRAAAQPGECYAAATPTLPAGRPICTPQLRLLPGGEARLRFLRLPTSQTGGRKSRFDTLKLRYVVLTAVSSRDRNLAGTRRCQLCSPDTMAAIRRPPSPDRDQVASTP